MQASKGAKAKTPSKRWNGHANERANRASVKSRIDNGHESRHNHAPASSVSSVNRFKSAPTYLGANYLEFVVWDSICMHGKG